ncbi:hypothetical protein, partial [Loktanella sp. IMCC34160]|uniref:hypothetical protein n=1 Tax=Loktanella sp. IMCC34160 TaxID=2510646 RepID=UPI001A91FE06
MAANDLRINTWIRGISLTIAQAVEFKHRQGANLGGPQLPFIDRSRCCDRSPLCGHSLRLQIRGIGELVSEQNALSLHLRQRPLRKNPRILLVRIGLPYGVPNKHCNDDTQGH